MINRLPIQLVPVRASDAEFRVTMLAWNRFRVEGTLLSGQTLPDMHVGPYQLATSGVEVLNANEAVQWFTPTSSRGRLPSANRNFTGACYSPIGGFRHAGIIHGVSVLYNLATFPAECHVNYDRRNSDWEVRIRWRRERDEPYAAPSNMRVSFEIVLGIAPAEPGVWCTAFEAYRTHWRNETLGRTRAPFRLDPIASHSLANRPTATEDNPRGYTTCPWNGVRYNLRGFRGFKRWAKDVLCDSFGFKRLMLWGGPGVHLQSGRGMPWFIGSDIPNAARKTLHEVTEAVNEYGIQVGFWWGWVLWAGGDFEGNGRRRLTVDDFNTAARELEPLYEAGVRLFGLDAYTRRIVETPTNPDLFVALDFLEYLQKWYPEAEFVIEAAGNDRSHLAGASYVWANRLSGPEGQEWCNWLNETPRPLLGVMQAHMTPMTQELFDTIKSYGAVPMVRAPWRYGITNTEAIAI